MKKTSILTLATAVAIVATTAGTFAVWDTLETTATADIVVNGQSIVLAQPNLTLSATPSAIGGNEIEYTGTVDFNITGDITDAVNTLNLEPKLYASDGTTPIDPAKATITLTEAGGGTGLTNNIDSNIGAKNQYTVTVVVKDSQLNNSTLKASVKAELTKQ